MQTDDRLAGVLVVDDDATCREAILGQLRRAGVVCCAADSYQAAIEIARDDSRLKVALLDHLPGPIRLADAVSQLRSMRPDLRLIGNSGHHRRSEFARMGVGDYLQKPWTLDQLRRLLDGGILECVVCELPLPLRRPEPGQAAQTWICSGCGSRYYALLDPRAPQDVRQNIRIDNAVPR